MTSHPAKRRNQVARASGFVVRDGSIGGTQARGGRRGLPPTVPYRHPGDQPQPAQLAAEVRAQLNPVRLRLVSDAAGRPVPGVPEPAWLMSYSPEARNGSGAWKWTGDPLLAMILPTPELAIKLWTTIPKRKPRRPWDGKPNRPLTQFTVLIERVPDVPVDELPVFTHTTEDGREYRSDFLNGPNTPIPPPDGADGVQP